MPARRPRPSPRATRPCGLPPAVTVGFAYVLYDGFDQDLGAPAMPMGNAVVR